MKLFANLLRIEYVFSEAEVARILEAENQACRGPEHPHR
jgi:hypothetical protein